MMIVTIRLKLEYFKIKTTRLIKGIFFDAGDTLFEAKEPIGVFYSRMAAAYGVEMDSAVLDQKFKAVFRKCPPLAFPGVSGDELFRLEFGWWHQVVQSLFSEVDFPQFDLFFKSLYHFFEKDRAWRLFPETKEVLEKLRKDQYIIGIISNFDSRLLSICEHLGIRDYFDIIVFSSREAAAKPCPEIFQQTLKRLDLMPEESVYVGDHFENDIEGAQGVGMIPVFLDRKGVDPRAVGLVSIKDLRGIYPLLNSMTPPQQEQP